MMLRKFFHGEEKHASRPGKEMLSPLSFFYLDHGL
jgi:hypothetical protein